MLLVCESVAGADTSGTPARYKRDMCVWNYATWRPSPQALCDHPVEWKKACLGDTDAIVNRSSIASDTEPPASFHVKRGGDPIPPRICKESAMTTPAYQSPPTLPERRPRRGLIIGILAVLIIGFGTAGGLFFYGWQQTRQPVDAALAFCSDLKAQRYVAAYGRLSHAYQVRVSKDQFVAAATVHDTIDGKVLDCGTPNTGVAFSFDLSPSSKTTLSASITRNRSFAGKLSLVKEGSAWKIDSIDQSLEGSDLGALVTGQAFCNALVSGNYAAAYALQSARQQAQANEKDFAAAIKATFSGNLKLADCKPDPKTYTVIGTSAKIDAVFVVALTTSSGAQRVNVPVTLHLVEEGGVWKLDDFVINAPSA